MNHKQLFITVSCLVLFAASGMAQQEELSQEQMDAMALRLQKEMLENVFRPHWEGQGINLEILKAFGDPVVRVAWGISDEHYERIEEHTQTLFLENTNNISEALEVRMQKVNGKSSLSTHLRENAEMPTMEEIMDFAKKLSSLMMDTVTSVLTDELTSEQWQKINESQLANMEKMPLISPSMFEALNLTDAQREQMGQIKKELDPEFEAVLKNWVDGLIALQKITSEAPEFKRIRERIQSQGRAFATQFKIAMFDVLTDEQWIRLQNLIDNPPEHALVFRKMLRKLAGESEEASESEASESSDAWVPGPNSWRPGDAIPETYRIERNTRRQFPRGEE